MTKKTIQVFAKHIDDLRQDRGLSFQEMANVCDMDKAQVYKICTKGVDLRFSSLIKLSKGLNVSIQTLFDFKY